MGFKVGGRTGLVDGTLVGFWIGEAVGPSVGEFGTLVGSMGGFVGTDWGGIVGGGTGGVVCEQHIRNIPLLVGQQSSASPAAAQTGFAAQAAFACSVLLTSETNVAASHG